MSVTTTVMVQLEVLLDPSVTVHTILWVPGGSNLLASVLVPSNELMAVTGQPSLVVGLNSVPCTV